jgi:protein involved in polysaccharide export with SLBB domain
VGQVFVANLTVDQLRDVLYTRLGRVYSGVRRGSDAKIRFDLSVANVRVNQVYVVGEVRQPGAYQISALGTALTALYAAGGITARSNMRRIEVRRLDQIVATLDLYDYLLRGIKHDDIRLQTGDVVYVPLRGKRAQITGAILRPAIYELGEVESLPDLLRAAGGFRADAALERLSVHRIVPIPQRGSGPFPRTVVDVQLPTVASVAGDDPPPAPRAPGRFGNVWVPGLGLEDGDSVVVDAIAPLDSSFFVAIAGAVNKPGRYPWREGLTLRELVVAARGPKVGASLKEAEIARLPEDRSTGRLAETVRVPLDSTYLLGRDSAGRYIGPPGTAFPAKGAPEIPLRPYYALGVMPASPKNTNMARLSRSISSSSSRPIRDPSFVFGTVVILSTIRRLGERSPFRSVGSTGSRNSGASVASVVSAHTVMESVASNRSSCTITTGRGFPA